MSLISETGVPLEGPLLLSWACVDHMQDMERMTPRFLVISALLGVAVISFVTNAKSWADQIVLFSYYPMISRGDLLSPLKLFSPLLVCVLVLGAIVVALLGRGQEPR